MQMEQSSSKAKSLCERLKDPPATTSRAIASLFPACGSKRKFDSLQDCVAREETSPEKSSQSSSEGSLQDCYSCSPEGYPSLYPEGYTEGGVEKSRAGERSVIPSSDVSRGSTEGYS